MIKRKFYIERYYERKYNWQFHLIPFICIENWDVGISRDKNTNLFFITIGWLFWGIIFGVGENIE
jgi:hypothetical protein